MNILFLSHCVPFPPNKGDRVRAYYLLKELAKEHTIFLHAMSKDPVAPDAVSRLDEYCESVHIHPLSRLLSLFFTLCCLPSRYPLSFGYFFSYSLLRGMKKTLAEQKIDLVFAYSSSTGPFAMACNRKCAIADLVDADSAKWGEYAAVSKFPKRLIFQLEHRRLRNWEKRIQEACDITLVCSAAERDKLGEIAPDARDKVFVVKNGIDFEKFFPSETRVTTPSLIFTGQMDYLPNIDAVLYFYSAILPLIRKSIPSVSFTIVGRNPDPIIAESCPDAIVTGEVKDINRHLTEAAVFVAPLRLAYGIQNKVLEAMASGIPVVGSPQVQRGLAANPGRDLLIAESVEEFSACVVELLMNPEKAEYLRRNALEFVRENHDWERNIVQVRDSIRMTMNIGGEQPQGDGENSLRR